MGRIKAWFRRLWEKLRLVDWSAFLTAIYKAVKPEDRRIDPKYIVVKPRILSDANILRGVAALRAVLAFIPATAIAAPLLSLGEIGFNIFKHIALKEDLDHIRFIPIDPNLLRFAIQQDPELSKHYGDLTARHNWNPAAISTLERVYNDFSFLTDEELLRAKYPQISWDYIKDRCAKNRDTLQESLSVIEQEIIKIAHKPEVNHNVREALEALKNLFPAMRDWGLFNSKGFNELVDLIDVAI